MEKFELLKLNFNSRSWIVSFFSCPLSSVLYQVRTHVPPSFSSAPSSSMSISTWPRQDHDSLSQLNCGDLGLSTPLVADVNESGLPACFQCDITSSENLVLEVRWFCRVFVFTLYHILDFALAAYFLLLLLIFDTVSKFSNYITVLSFSYLNFT